MTPTEIMRGRRDGSAAAARGAAFDANASPAWRNGWTIEARRLAAENRDANDMTEVDAALQILRRACLRLASKGPQVAELARAVIATALADELSPDAELEAARRPLPFPAQRALEE